MAKLKINLNFSLSRLDLAVKGLVTTQYLGQYQSVFKGQGLEFADYRTYTQGADDASLIDWKASKRANNLLVKEFVEERNVEVIFMVDVSSQMLAGSIQKLKAEYIAEVVSALGYNILKAGDSVGLLLFSDKITKYYPPQSGLKQFYVLTNNLSQVSNYGGYSDIPKALDFVFKHGSDNSLIILISDFIYDLKSTQIFEFAAKKFDFISFLVRDPLDVELPEGTGEVLIQDPYSGETLLVDPTMMREEYAKNTKARIEEIRKLMRKVGGDYLYLQTDKPFETGIIKFFKMRADRR